MKKPMIALLASLPLLALGLASFVEPAPAQESTPINWQNVPASEITLFYPGQSSWEWVLTPSDHPGAQRFREGKNCAECHTGDEVPMGDLLVSGEMNEPAPIAGKPGSVVAHVQFAHDAENLYVRIAFDEGTQPDAGMDTPNATDVTMMIAGEGFPEATRAGCWAMCHDDSQGMASAGDSDRTLYLPRTRAHLTRQGGGDELKPADELDAMRNAGYVAEYWQAQLNPGASATADNGTIFDRRTEAPSTDVNVQSSFADGIWTVTMSRPLNAGQGTTPIVPGSTYMVGFSIHTGHTVGRFHYVSFERSFVLDQGDADFVVVGQ